MSSFRFLDLPDELRLKMYRYMLPHNERLHLDPSNVQFPIPYIVPESYGSTFNLLRVCKMIYVEAMQFVYRHNTVNLIDHLRAEELIPCLGKTAQQYMTKLEVHVSEGLVDLGDIWEFLHNCVSLTDLRLVFYHERKNWSRTLAQLAWRISQSDEGAGDCNIDLDVELYTSIWARYGIDYAHQFHEHWIRAEKHAAIYSYNFPSQLRHVTITASVNPDTADDLCELADDAETREFRPFGTSDVANKKTLRFQRVIE